MGAVIRTGGKQYRVEVGQLVLIERLSGEAGDAVSFGEVLSLGEGEGLEVGTPTVPGVVVHGKIVEQKRGRKILVFRRKRRKNFRRLNGHRQYQSIVEVTAIGSEAPEAKESQTKAPQAKAPQTKAPQTKAPQTEAPKTEEPVAQEPVAKAAKPKKTAAPAAKSAEKKAPAQKAAAPKAKASDKKTTAKSEKKAAVKKATTKKSDEAST